MYCCAGIYEFELHKKKKVLLCNSNANYDLQEV